MPLYNNRAPIEVDLVSGAVFPTGLTTLPSSPIEGDEIIVAVDTAPTVWNFKWASAIAAWVFIGGPPMESTVTSAETTTSATFTDLATVGPSLTVPRNGSYIIGMYGRMQNGTATNGAAMGPTSTTLGAATNARSIRADSSTAAAGYRISGFTDQVTLGVGETLKLQYEVIGGAGTATFSDRRIQLTPYTIT